LFWPSLMKGALRIEPDTVCDIIFTLCCASYMPALVLINVLYAGSVI